MSLSLYKFIECNSITMPSEFSLIELSSYLDLYDIAQEVNLPVYYNRTNRIAYLFWDAVLCAFLPDEEVQRLVGGEGNANE